MISRNARNAADELCAASADLAKWGVKLSHVTIRKIVTERSAAPG